MYCFFDNYKNQLLLMVLILNQLLWTFALETKDNNSSENIYPVVGGTRANLKEFPHMARLGSVQEDAKETDWFCGGVLISNKFVLTAAHCFFATNGILNRVQLGVLDFQTEIDARPLELNVLRNIQHPKYREDQIYNDIGLVELMGPVNFSEYIAPACLPNVSDDDFKRFTAIGWGATRFAGSDSEVLLKASLERYGAERCGQLIEISNRWPSGLDENVQICAGSDGGRTDTCHGDSGGPLLVQNKFPCMYYVVGITSSGIGCGFANFPGIYTRVFNYLSWIQGIICSI